MNATERSIIGQFDYWDNAPDHPLRADMAQPQIVVGCGTSYNLPMSVATAMTLRGFRALAVPGSEWALRPRTVLADETGTVVVALSRSGESTETVEAARRSRTRGLTVVGITCAPGSSLTRETDVVLAADTHPDEGIVMTASASLMTLMAFRYAGYVIPAGASRDAAQVMRALDEGLPRVLQGRTHFVVLGSGPLYGIAQEGALKLQEMSISYTQAFHPMEYRHGPISLLDERTVVVVLYSTELQAEEEQLVREMQEKGARVIGIGGPGDLSIPLDRPEVECALLCLPALQILGERIAQARNIDSLAPRHLTKVVRVAA